MLCAAGPLDQFIYRTRALQLAGRLVADADPGLAWVTLSAPLWAAVRVCLLLRPF